MTFQVWVLGLFFFFSVGLCLLMEDLEHTSWNICYTFVPVPTHANRSFASKFISAQIKLHEPIKETFS